MTEVNLFGEVVEDIVKKEWIGMPTFVQDADEAFQTIIVRFRNQEDVDKFSELTNHPITPKTQRMWFPKLEAGLDSFFVYSDESGK